MTGRQPGRRIRVAHVIQNMNYGGMERVLSDLIMRTDPARFELHLVVLQYLGRFAEGLDRYATLHTAPPMGRLSMLWPVGLARTLQRIAPDIVHTHSGVWYKASRAARMAGVPVVVHTEHGRPSPDRNPGRFIDGIASRWTTRTIAVSEALQAQLARTLVADPARVEVIPNGIDEVAYAGPGRTEARKALGIGANELLIGSVGRLEPIKGYDVMVEAFGALNSTWTAEPRPVLAVVGEGSLRPALEARARALGVGDWLRLLGWRDDVPQWLAACDVFTLSSRSEGTSISLLEAMAAGRCPVVTDVGGNRAVLGPGLAHRLVDSENPAALAAAWRDALTDGPSRTRDASAAAVRVHEAYSLSAMVAAYERLYDRLIA